MIGAAGLFLHFTAVHGCRECQLVSLDFKSTSQCPLFPFLEVADHAEPCTRMVCLEHQFVIGRLGRFHEEDFDECACLLAEMHTGLDDLRVVEYHQCSFRQVFRKLIELVFRYLSVFVEQELAMVAFGQRELGDACIGEWVIVIGNTDMLRIFRHDFLY